MKKIIMWYSGWNKKKFIGGLALTVLLAVIAASAYRMYEEQEKKKLIAEKGSVKIVCLGDSIWDICRDDTGIAALTAQNLQAEVINLAIMGTSAAYRSSDRAEDADLWNSKSLLGVVETVTGGENKGLPLEEIQRLNAENPEIASADYFLIAYGLNDYFSAVPRESTDPYDVYTYGGALRTAVEKLQAAFPGARIMILSQTYCQGYSYGKVDSESDWKDYGGGTAPDYVETARKVAEEYGLVFVDNYKEMGINIHNGTKYLSDATHLSERGRRKYAKILAEHILQDYRNG